MKKSSLLFLVGKLPLDLGAALCAWLLAWKIRPVTDLIPFLHSYFDPKFIPEFSFILEVALWSAPFFVLSLAFFGAYRAERIEREVGRLLLASLVWAMGMLSFYALAFHEVIFSRMMLVQAMIFSFFLALLFRFLLYIFQRWLLRRGIGKTSIFLAGSDKEKVFFVKELSNAPDYSLVADWKEAEEVWILESELQNTTLREQLLSAHKVLRFAADIPLDFAQMDFVTFGGRILFLPESSSLTPWGRVSKRIFDIVASLTLLLLFAPLFLLAIVGILIETGRPIFYAGKRIGRQGKPFPTLKFRSMVVNADDLKKDLSAKNHRKDSPFFKVKNDPRVTTFGRFLRRFSLDELPQLMNVLQGKMSLVGPRPHLPEEVAAFTPEYKQALSIKPGITGLAQTSGRSDLSFAEEMRLDLLYLKEWSLLLDIKILLKTFFVMLHGKGAD